jgi:hypothetical protein
MCRVTLAASVRHHATMLAACADLVVSPGVEEASLCDARCSSAAGTEATMPRRLQE